MIVYGSRVDILSLICREVYREFFVGSARAYSEVVGSEFWTDRTPHADVGPERPGTASYCRLLWSMRRMLTVPHVRVLGKSGTGSVTMRSCTRVLPFLQKNFPSSLGKMRKGINKKMEKTRRRKATKVMVGRWAWKVPMVFLFRAVFFISRSTDV